MCDQTPFAAKYTGPNNKHHKPGWFALSSIAELTRHPAVVELLTRQGERHSVLPRI